ncbi:non-homologous end-joining DNA ligase [Bosea sp. BIWAKO-01]|uniref:non-homologous end-joining DNA ligase n=1 Tax=Bosea sp. BIWAKO-01 TaxID=506668 RepID=UPI00086F853E|nr:non-homologous end-joining DNA ligase [Bosea sp. BIWAKO-01]GAU84707.1 ATP-dependent DNA ligase [Bosea sp. BIWAKO-01]
MPDRVEPCLAKLATKPPEGENWAYEVKWDGYRIAIHIQPGKVRILTRGGHDCTNRFPTVAEATKVLRVYSAILDGEAVVLDEQGRSDFSALQNALGGRGGTRNAHLAVMFAFDILYLNGQDLRRMPLAERRDLLAPVIQGAAPGIMLSEEVDADGPAFLTLACELGLEGIIAKRRNTPYRSGRGGEWLKIKCIQSEGFFIIGYEPSSSALGGIGRLLLAAWKNNRLTYVGSVGTGFTDRSATALREQLDALLIDQPALNLTRKGTRWVTPSLVAEIEFRGLTTDQKLRHGSYKGLRDVADADGVLRLDEV